MNSDWTAADLARALGEGTETEFSRALADLSVVALSASAAARGGEWDGSWDDAIALGRRIRAVVEAFDDRTERRA